MDIETKLQAICDYYNRTRRCGHSYTALFGIKDRAIVLAANPNSVEYLMKEYAEYTGITLCRTRETVGNVRFISLYCLNLDKLRGMKAPLVLDNFAIQTLCNEALEKIRSCEQDLKLVTDIKESYIERYLSEIKELQKENLELKKNKSLWQKVTTWFT